MNVKLRQPLNGQWRLRGELMHVDEQSVVLALADGRSAPETVRVEMPAIAEARLVVKI